MIKLKKQQYEQYILLTVWFMIGVFGRLIPHLPNMTPLLSLGLLSGALFSKRVALVFMAITMLLSDYLLAYIKGYPAFGSWTWFTYSAFLAIVYLGAYLSSNVKWIRAILFVMASSFGFWLWTNLGTWLLSGMYPTTLAGLMACYVAALPFLKNTLLGSLIWMLIFLGSFVMLSKRKKERLRQPQY